MTPLDAAWVWYESTRLQVGLFQRLIRRHWDVLPWDQGLARDAAFAGLDRDRVLSAAPESLAYLNDLAVVVLFSAFEDVVRTAALDVIDRHAAAASHPVVSSVMAEGRERIEAGSFFHVLAAYKPGIDPGLIEQVNQVRRYRNWVSHGRRAGEIPDNVTPRAAYDRLRAFLAVLGLV
jgi:hypothetical protein